MRHFKLVSLAELLKASDEYKAEGHIIGETKLQLRLLQLPRIEMQSMPPWHADIN